jgi:uncharacterized tellurite resistance protein B-like protein
MLNQIKLFFDQHMALSAPDENVEQNLHLACAALFIEMMHMDDKAHTEEHEIILSRFKAIFSLSSDQASSLISLATKEWQHSTDYYQFTSLINKEFTQQQKIELIKTLWQIAYVDGELNMHEEHMVRKMADLLHVPHRDFIKTKHQVNGA